MFRKFAVVFLIIAGLGILVGLVIASRHGKKISNDSNLQGQTATLADSLVGVFTDQNSDQSSDPTSDQTERFPFDEMTIPYLRGREYISTLSALQNYQQHATYNSYLTSYDSDGLQINGLLTKPNGQVPIGGWPAIVFVHGFIPPDQYRTEAKYEAYVDYLAKSGFVVFKIDLRGHDESDGEAGGAYYSPDYIIDTLNARAALASSNFVNPNKIGLWGHSMAGNVVLRSQAVRPEIPAIVIWAGAVLSYADFSDFGISDSSYRPPGDASTRQQRRQELFDTHGRFDPQSAFWQKVDPTYYLSDIFGAIQIHHAVDDDVVDVGYGRNLNSRLDQTNVFHEYYEYSSGGHNISNSSFGLAMSRTADFFTEKLTEFD